MIVAAPRLTLKATARNSAAARPRHRLLAFPCWLISLLAHMGVFVACGILLGNVPRGGSLLPHTFETTIGGEPGSGPIGIELPGPPAAGGPAGAEEAVSTPPPAPDPAPATTAEVEPVRNLPPPPPKLEVTVSVPANGRSSSGFQGQSGRGNGFGNPAGGGNGGTGSGRGFGIPGGTGTSLFGIPSDGKKVVYVFDRSSSMSSGQPTPLAVAKAELLASLEQLPETDQFQVIFYNATPTAFSLPRQAPALLRATAANKVLVRNFIGGIIADGGTQHEEALTFALRLNPDTIYFLTDADQPVLLAGQLDHISRLNRRHVVIHAVEFGRGPSLGDNNFLVQIAQQNYGKYTYVDLNRVDLDSQPPAQE